MKIGTSQPAVDDRQGCQGRRIIIENAFQETFRDPVGGTPQELIMPIVAMDETRHIPIGDVRHTRRSFFEGDAIPGIIASVKQ